MTISRRRFIAITAAAAFAPNKAVGAQRQSRRWTGIAMGARASLTISNLDAHAFAKMVVRVTAEIERLEKMFSLYRSESDLVSLNRTGRLDNPPGDFLRLLSLASSIARATGGAFDPTIQSLWQLYAQSEGRPDRRQVERVRSLIGWQHVRFDGNSVGYAKPGMAMTLNGIAQGYATDRIAILLREMGLQNVLVSVGEIAALGEREPGQPWQIGISDTEDGAPGEAVMLKDNAIATSAPSGTTFDNAKSAGHILDPRTGRPASCWRRISVINASAAIADGLSTAFCAMNRRQISDALGLFPHTSLIAVDQTGTRISVDV